MTELAFHPYANLFPLIEGRDFEEFCAGIKADGILHDKIVLLEGQILDGRNRYRACQATGTTPHFETFNPNVHGDPLTYVISKNLHRRHLTESQRAMLAADLATMKQGERTDVQPSANLQKVSQADAAKLTNVSTRSVASATKVRNEGTPELRDAVKQGHVPVSVAEKAVALPPEKQLEIVRRAKSGDASGAKAEVKKATRDKREVDLGDKQRALPDKKFGLIAADIPRHFNVHSDETGMDRAPENHYPTMSFDELCKMPIASIAADDCILVFWSTNASLIDDIEIMAEWGFVTLRPRTPDGALMRTPSGKLFEYEKAPVGRYCSMQVWDKVRIGLGYWFRDRHEFILIGVRGNVVPPAQGTQDESLFSEPKGKHSEKPEHVLAMIDRLWPTIPKIELFARRRREGWEAWGLEAPGEIGSNASVPAAGVAETASDEIAVPSRDLYREAIEVVREHNKASPSLVQRILQLNWNTASALIERMEADGLVSPANHAGKREAYLNKFPAPESIVGEAEANDAERRNSGGDHEDVAPSSLAKKDHVNVQVATATGERSPRVDPVARRVFVDDEPDEIPDSMRRVTLTQAEKNLAARIDLDQLDRAEKAKITLLRSDPSAATVATRSLLLDVAERQGLMMEDAG